MAEFISDDTTSDTIFSYAQSATALTVSSTQYLGFAGLLTATEGNVTIPVPVAGTLKNLIFSMSTSPAANVVVTVNINGSNSSLTATVAAGDTSIGNYSDLVHTASVAAGNYIDIQTVTGAGAQTAIPAATLAFVPTDGVSAVLWGNIAGATASTTAGYSKPIAPITSATEANEEATSPIACTLSHLYVYQSVANGAGVTTTFTLWRGVGSTGAAAATAITGTIAPATTGAQAVDTTHSVAIAAGDRVTLQYVTNTGTSGAMGGWSMKCL
jgi:hypothetical protein